MKFCLSDLFLKHSAYLQFPKMAISYGYESYQWWRYPTQDDPGSNPGFILSTLFNRSGLKSLVPGLSGCEYLLSPNFTLTEKHFSNFTGIFRYCPKPLPLSYSDIGTKDIKLQIRATFVITSLLGECLSIMSSSASKSISKDYQYKN